MKIYLSPSTQYNNIYENRLTNEMDVCERISTGLTAKLAKYDVEVIHRKRSEMLVPERIAEANKLDVDYYLSIHTNAYNGIDGKGCEVYYQNGLDKPASVKTASKEFAINLCRDMANITTLNTQPMDRGIKTKRYSDGVRDGNMELRGVNKPACLIEIEFHDTKLGCAWILANTSTIIDALLKSIVETMKLVLKPVTPPVPEDEFWFVQVSAHKTLADAEADARIIADDLNRDVVIKYGSKNALKWVANIPHDQD